MWRGSRRQSIFLQNYRSRPKVYHVYFIHVPEDGTTKVGRSCRLFYRLKNLRQSIYKEHTIHVVTCTDGKESGSLETHLKKVLIDHHISGEWFRVGLDKINELITRIHPHLLFTPLEEEQPPLYKKTELLVLEPNYDIAIS